MRRLILALLCITTTYGLQAQSLKSTVDSNNVFAFTLFSKLKNRHSLFFSPFSISTAFAMAYSGANGETQEQIAHVMRFNIESDTVQVNFKKLIKSINDENEPGVQLEIANSVWAQKNYHFLGSYFNTVIDNYNSEIKSVDFITEPEETRQEINSWVKEKTNNKILNFFPKQSLSSSNRMVLVNACYFNCEWANAFPVKSIRKEQFFPFNKKESVNINFMNITERYKYYEDEKFQVLEIPYKDTKMSFVIFLPLSIDSLGNDGDIFNYGYYTTAITLLKPQEVEVSLPKFKLTQSYNLGNVLSDMGMHDAFIPNLADFSKMTGAKNLFISRVIHKSYIDVTEKGTEAVGVTGIAFSISLQSKNPVIKIFNANHPFFFVIRDNSTGSILFMGELVNPNNN